MHFCTAPLFGLDCLLFLLTKLFLAAETLKGRGTGREQVLTARVEPWKGVMRSFKQNFVLTVRGMGFSLFKTGAGYNRM